ncbi:YfiR family protein [Geomonas sp. RF6]|uniref:YfiR family protein n=1 Tax=Geomonas sp. RF6 TaxID=2897342 RepID=UPI001E5D5D1D|nr:YfiR family protein [Geomonas sp. RF6]UFS69225.1 YfiR family protein [Geomonas sp. RF6]
MVGSFLLCALLLMGLFVSRAPAEETSAASAPQVKAAFLYNFLKFTEFPDAPASGTICLGVLGKDTFGDALDGVRGKTARGRKVVIARFRRVDEVKECDVLFISESEKGRLPHVLRALQGTHTLTVGDQEGFCEAGGMINLISSRNKVGFEVNVGAANRARVRISSQLLKLARSVFE